MKRPKLNYVDRGTYQKIAKTLGYSRSHVVKVANGGANNALIEEKLMEAIEQRIEREKRFAKFHERLKRRKSGKAL